MILIDQLNSHFPIISPLKSNTLMANLLEGVGNRRNNKWRYGFGAGTRKDSWSKMLDFLSYFCMWMIITHVPVCFNNTCAFTDVCFIIGNGKSLK